MTEIPTFLNGRNAYREDVELDEKDEVECPDIDELIESCKKSRVSDYDPNDIEEFTNVFRKHLKTDDVEDLTLIAKMFMGMSMKKSGSLSEISKENKPFSNSVPPAPLGMSGRYGCSPDGKKSDATRKCNDLNGPSSFRNDQLFPPSGQFNNDDNLTAKFQPNRLQSTSNTPNKSINSNYQEIPRSKIPETPAQIPFNDELKTPAATSFGSPDTNGTFDSGTEISMDHDSTSATPNSENNSPIVSQTPTFNLGQSTKKNAKISRLRSSKKGVPSAVKTVTTDGPPVPETVYGIGIATTSLRQPLFEQKLNLENTNETPTFNLGKGTKKNTRSSRLGSSKKGTPSTLKNGMTAGPPVPETPLGQPLFEQKDCDLSAMECTPYQPTAVKSRSHQPSAMKCTPYMQGTVRVEDSPMSVDPIFNIGSGDFKFKTPGKRTPYNRRVKSPRSHTTRGGLSSIATPEMNGPIDESGEEKVSTKDSKDDSGLKEMVEIFRKDAGDHYKAGNYKDAIIVYTNLLDRYSCHDNTRAVLLANRSAALLMLGAYTAAGCDCINALESIPTVETKAEEKNERFTEGGPFLSSKIYTRMGKAHAKLGHIDASMKAYNSAIDVAEQAMSIQEYSNDAENLTYLRQIQIDADTGRRDILRYKEEMEAIQKIGLHNPNDAKKKTKRINQTGLFHINEALNISPGDTFLQGMKISILSALQRWRELYLYCETIAASTVKFDGVFTKDLAKLNPLSNVSLATHLKPDTFDGFPGSKDGGGIKLSSKAVAEVILRISPKLQPTYLRSLRLEDRCRPALSALSALSTFIVNLTPYRIKEYQWLEKEKRKIEQTIQRKDAGDTFFRNGKYDGAVKEYTACLVLDSEGVNGIGEKKIGGRLNAVLHCNRAAAYMALSKYRDAISDCSAALLIYPRYMKAMLRRCRCYVRLNRFEEALTNYEHYIRLVQQARKSRSSAEYSNDISCNFDSPHDVRDSDLDAARNELSEVKRAKLKVERNAKTKNAEDERRQKWYNSSFGDNVNNDAQRRRQQWYNQENDTSRRWDSFNGSAPNRNTRSKSEQPRPESKRKEDSWQSNKSNVNCNYKILGVAKTGSAADIKKAYRKAALKYHPDKNQDVGAPDMFRRLQQAYNVLKDPVQRRDYDTENRWS